MSAPLTQDRAAGHPAPVPADASSAPLQGGMLVGAALLLAAANFLAVLDTTIANVSVPTISGALGATTSQGTYVITSYAVAEAITVPLTGWLAARFGAVRVFVLAMLLFGLFSALCGVAPSLNVLVGFRVLQGLAGGPLMPLSQTLLYHNGYEEGSRAPGVERTLPLSIIVGTQALHAVGIAWAMRHLGERDSAAVAFLGDGGTSQGEFYEALNFAGVWQAPAVFVVQNNQWAISMPRSRQTRAATLAQKAIAAGIPGIVVDGND